MPHPIRSSSRGQRVLENMRANSATTCFARVRATNILRELSVAMALTHPSGFADAVTRAPMSAGVSSGIEARQRRSLVKDPMCLDRPTTYGGGFECTRQALEGRSSNFQENLRQLSLWNPALHLLRPSRLHLHRPLNSWSKRSARQTGEHGRPIPFRPCNMLSRLSDQRNSLLWIRCRLSFVRQDSSRSFAQQVLRDCLGTVQVRCANFPNRSWPNRHWAFFLTLASERPTSARPNSARIKVLPFFT